MSGRIDWKRSSHQEQRDFVAAARRYASEHPSPAVRMFIFQLCKGVEAFIKKEKNRAETQKECTGL
jgi:hypothetical protein